jgi:hypothetical protein
VSWFFFALIFSRRNTGIKKQFLLPINSWIIYAAIMAGTTGGILHSCRKTGTIASVSWQKAW